MNHILPKIINTSVRFWQRAYIKERDRQELIFLLKIAIDDFRHISSKFYTIFVDFCDAFGSLNQDYLIRTLLNSDIAKGYCEIIADIYQDSHFQVICGKELTKEFLLTKGTKTGCPLSAVLFIIDLDKSLKEVHNLAIISRNIEDEKRISPIPAGGYADDVVLISYVEDQIKDMLSCLIEQTKPSGLEIRPDKCAAFFERRSGNRWYRAKLEQEPKLVISNERIRVYKRWTNCI